jgi:hypothetical protein
LCTHRNSATRAAVVAAALDLGQRGQALPGEAFGEQGQKVRDAAAHRELVVAGVQEPFDGFAAEDVGELVGDPDGGGVQGELLIDGQVVAAVAVGEVDVGLGHGVLRGMRAGATRSMRAAMSA